MNKITKTIIIILAVLFAIAVSGCSNKETILIKKSYPSYPIGIAGNYCRDMSNLTYDLIWDNNCKEIGKDKGCELKSLIVNSINVQKKLTYSDCIKRLDKN